MKKLILTALLSASFFLTACSESLLTRATVIEVNANAGWTKSGVVVEKGQSLTISASGKWSNGGYTDGSTPTYGPEGGSRIDTSVNVPIHDGSVNVGTLVAKVGDGQPFKVGTQLTTIASQAGELHFTINDDLKTLSDNAGTVTVKIQ